LETVVRFLLRVMAIGSGLWRLACQRLLYEPGLTLALLVGWLAAVALVSAIPMYTDAIHQALLRKELRNEENSRRPAFGFLFQYVRTSQDPQWESYLALDQYLETTLPQDFALPRLLSMHYAKSDLFQFFPALAGSYTPGDEPLGRVNLGFIVGLDTRITLLEGRMPASAWSPGDPVEVLVYRDFAQELGLQVGESYVLFNSAGVAGASKDSSLPVRIAGIWQATDVAAPFWYIPPTAFATVLLTDQTLYQHTLHTAIPRPLYDLGWYVVFDGSRVRAENVQPFLDRIAVVENRLSALLPSTRLTLSPVAALQRYQVTVSAQALLILLLGLPVIGLTLLFITLIANNMVEHQQLEMAILKSRGSSNQQIALIFLLQGLTLAVLALLLGLPLGRLAAQAMGATRQFLDFQRNTPLLVAVTQESMRFALVAGLLALLVTIAPALRAAQTTVVTAKQQASRPQAMRLWWQIGLDGLLLLAAGYGYYLLNGQGSVAQLQVGQAVNAWENPLLFLAPALFLWATGRLYLHLLPITLAALAWITAWLPGITMPLTLRNLARNRHQYSALITLLLLTTGLGAYVTSFAQTSDENLVARTAYRIGASLVLTEGAGKIDRTLTNRQPSTAVDRSTSASDASASSEEGLPGWAILPVSEHLRVPGVRAAARVGRFQANVRTPNAVVTGELYGIDRQDFPKVAYFRRDFAPLSLGALMNELALEPAGLLVGRSFLQENRLQIGDAIQLTGLIAGTNQPLLFKIVGALELFPTAYPSERTFFVANLDYIFDQLGGALPYYVWLAVDDQLTPDHLVTALEGLDFQILKVEDVRAEVAAEQTRPERIGLFGFFSLGFLITTLLSILALVTHAFLMYQRRYIQLGILRAMGLSARQVAAMQAGEHLLTTVIGILGGAGLGLACSYLFIPFMQLGYQISDLVPPFVVVIAWRDVLLAVLLILGTSILMTIGVAWLLARLKMFNAIKLGETLH
jgi:putative ABC transport system permease protein